MFKTIVISFLKTLLTIGAQNVPQIVAVVNPPLGAIIGTCLTGVLNAQAIYGAGNGEAKLQHALSTLDAAAPLIVQTVETATGHQLTDQALLKSALQKITDGIVDLLNAFAMLPKANA